MAPPQPVPDELARLQQLANAVTRVRAPQYTMVQDGQHRTERTETRRLARSTRTSCCRAWH